MTEQTRMANKKDDYLKLNLTKDVEPWEDGLRTNIKELNYEWWYFDAHLSDGSDLVVTFYDKSMLRILYLFVDQIQVIYCLEIMMNTIFLVTFNPTWRSEY
ncbi:hypothetical protein [Companilactobacillus musae]|uniref:hypothetical protein n=1 Tax=Companilactobacillus musae TaxID=1903258 RepID=UPI000E658341|nr:hypothetical protein [Companilactobacillus musae]